MKNLLLSLVVFGLLGANACRWSPNANAADGGVAGWRNGVSRWNGTGYDSHSNQPGFSNSELADSNPSTHMTPYTTPTGPSPQRNPYYQSPSIDELQRALSASSSYQSQDGEDARLNTATTNSAASIDDPYETSRSPLSSVATSEVKNADSPTMKGKPATAPATTPEGMGKIDLDAAIAEEPPLEQQVVRWYQYPQRWMKGWNSNAEFGINGSDGNATTLALQTGVEIKRKSENQNFAIDFDYRQASSGTQTTENNGRLNVDYDRMIAQSNWSIFGKYGMEWDQFKAFDLRLNLNSGMGYHWIREDDATLVTRFGAGASREIGAPIDAWTPEAVFGIDSHRQLNSRNKVTAKLDYFPAWEDFSDFRIVADAAWEILLDDSENLSLKLAATDRYDSTPQGAKPNDVYYSLLLLYKF